MLSTLALLSLAYTQVVSALPQQCGSSNGTSSSTAASPLPSGNSSSPVATPESASTWWKPGCRETFVWSLDVAIPTEPLVSDTGFAIEVDNYGVDLFSTTKEQIAAYQAAGKHVICYFSGGVYEEWSPDRGNFTSSCYCDKGSSCSLAGWPNWWLDIHSSSCVENVRSVLQGRIELAKARSRLSKLIDQEKGCDAVDPDNMDAWTYQLDYGITSDDQYNHLSFLATTAHDNGLGITLKNAGKMIKEHPEVVDMFDIQVAESCNVWNECDIYQPFVDAKKPVVQIEYEGSISCTRPGYAVTLNSRNSLSYKLVKDMCHIACDA